MKLWKLLEDVLRNIQCPGNGFALEMILHSIEKSRVDRLVGNQDQNRAL